MAPRVFVSLLDEQQEYHRLQAAEARTAGGRAGVSVEIAFADSNALVQIHQIFEQIHAAEEARPTAIAVHSVTGEGLARVARNALNAGIGWILLNRRVDYIEELRRLRPDLPVAVVTPNQEEIGRIHGRQVRLLAPQGGLILYVQGPPDTSAAQDRLRATQAVLGDRYEWKLLNADWSEREAQKAVAGWLRLKTSENRRPTLIVAQNDTMAAGARQAVCAHNSEWSSVPVLGCDALPEGGQRRIAKGELAASIVLPPTAGAAVDLVGRWLRDKQPPPPEVVLSPVSYPPEAALRPR
jgi:ABC-type sugar transport system substrate-binding protein